MDELNYYNYNISYIFINSKFKYINLKNNKNNDKILTRKKGAIFMFEKLAKLIFDYSNIYEFADKYFINTAINILSNYYHINDYIKELSIISSNDKKIYEGSSYDLDKFKLTINLVNELNKKKV